MQMNTLLAVSVILLSLVLAFPLYADTTAYVSPRPSVLGNARVPDADINTNLLSAIAKNNTVSSLNVSVSAVNGIVILQGNVTVDSDASEFIALAFSIPGVLDIDTSHFTANNQPLSINLILSAKVRGAIVRGKAFGDATIDHLPINIYTNNGIVYLSGMVDSTAQMIYAIKLAQAVPGVPRVISMLNVKAGAVTLPN